MLKTNQEENDTYSKILTKEVSTIKMNQQQMKQIQLEMMSAIKQINQNILEVQESIEDITSNLKKKKDSILQPKRSTLQKKNRTKKSVSFRTKKSVSFNDCIDNKTTDIEFEEAQRHDPEIKVSLEKQSENENDQNMEKTENLGDYSLVDSEVSCMRKQKAKVQFLNNQFDDVASGISEYRKIDDIAASGFEEIQRQPPDNKDNYEASDEDTELRHTEATKKKTLSSQNQITESGAPQIFLEEGSMKQTQFTDQTSTKDKNEIEAEEDDDSMSSNELDMFLSCYLNKDITRASVKLGGNRKSLIAERKCSWFFNNKNLIATERNSYNANSEQLTCNLSLVRNSLKASMRNITAILDENTGNENDSRSPTYNRTLSRKNMKMSIRNRGALIGKNVSCRELSPQDERVDNCCQKSFNQFFLLSIRPEKITKSTEMHIMGKKFLDPLTFDSIYVMDEYSTSEDVNLSHELVSLFCFPKGIKIRLVPRCALEGAKRVGWIGEKSYSYQVHHFTNEKGKATHGVSITWKEELHLPEDEKLGIIKMLNEMRTQRKAANVISKIWRSYQERLALRREKESASRLSNFFQKFHPEKEKQNVETKQSMMFTKPFDFIRKSFEEEPFNPEEEILREIYELNKQAKLNEEENIFSEEQSSVIRSQKQLVGEGVTYELSPEKKEKSVKAKCQGFSSCSTMVENDKLEELIIVEKCVIITGIDANNLSLFLLALKEIVDLRRNSANIERINKSERHAFLKTIEAALKLSPAQSEIQYPQNDLEHVNEEIQMFETILCSKKHLNISIPLPLPQITSEFGVATLMLRFKLPNLLKILMLLLMERSVLVIGARTDEVSACTCALLDLLEPYKWASVFIPLLPPNMIEFVDSPVPFIAGVFGEDNEDIENITHNSLVHESVMHGASILNLVTGDVVFTEEAEIQETLLKCGKMIQVVHDFKSMHCYQNRLEDLARERDSTLHSLGSFFQYGASRRESLVLRKVKDSMYKFMRKLSGDITESCDAWEKYGKLHNEGEEFEFFPDLWIDPLRYQIELQERICRTQLFFSIVEEMKEKSSKSKKQRNYRK